MRQTISLLGCRAMLVMLACLLTWLQLSPAVSAAEFLVFKKTYTRKDGKPLTQTDTFQVLNPNTHWMLRVINGSREDPSARKISSATVNLNQAQVLKQSDFNQNVHMLERSVSLRSSNSLAVQLQGKPGGELTVDIIGQDTTAPIAEWLTPHEGQFLNTETVLAQLHLTDDVSGVNLGSLQLLVDKEPLIEPQIAPSPPTLETTREISLTLQEGPHTLSAQINDAAGNISDPAHVSFTVDRMPPLITNLNPLDGDTVNTARPAISANYSDAFSGVDVSSIRMFLDEVDVTTQFIMTENSIRFTPTNDLAEGEHAARVDVADRAGNAASVTWQFRVGASLTVVVESSPANGEGDVAVTRETIIRLSDSLAPSTVADESILFAEFGGQHLSARIHVSPDRRTLTLFYNDPLPASARVRVTLIGDGLIDERGHPADVDRDGVPGGVTFIDFDTLSLTPLPGTAICGRVFASELSTAPDGGSINVPLEGVTITVDGAEDSMRAVTNQFGNFRLEIAPAARFFVHVDGRTATNGVPPGAYYPFVGKAWESTPGEEVNVGNVFLPLVQAGTLQPVSQMQDTIIRMAQAVLEEFPQFADVHIRVPADSLYADEGSRGGRVGIAPVPPDRLPGQLPPGLNFPIVITVQTDGATNFDTPVPACFPNLPDPATGWSLPSGEKSALWSFNHDTGRFEIVGPMTATADGRFVCTDPGVGILAPGWHGANPGTPATGPLGTPPQGGPCEGLTTHDVVGNIGDLASAALKCIASLAGLEQFEQAMLSIITDLKGLLSSVLNLLHEMTEGGANVAQAREALKAINSSKGLIKTAFESFKDKNPVGLIRNALSCVKAILAAIDSICERSVEGQPTACSSFWIRAVCEGVDFLSALVNSLERLIAQVDSDFNVAGLLLALLCEAIEKAIEVLETISSAQEEQTATQATPSTITSSQGRATGVASSLTLSDSDPIPQEVVDNLRDAATAAQELLEKLEPINQLFKDVGDVKRLTLEIKESATQLYFEQFGSPANAHHLIEIAGLELRGKTNGHGLINEILAPSSSYTLWVYDHLRNRLGVINGRTAEAGFETVLPALSFEALDDQPDSDGDRLVDIVERIVGTSPTQADTDGDGITDQAEVSQGTDPILGRVARTGIIATADTPGTAVDICAVNETAVVADFDRGVSVFNVFNGMNPIIVAQVDTPGFAQAVGCAGGRIAVADALTGLSVIDVSDPPAAHLLHQVDLGGEARAIATAGGIAYVGLETAGVVAVDLASGTELSRLAIPGHLEDLAISGNHLYVLTRTALHTVLIGSGELILVNSTPSPGSVGAGGRRFRLFVGGGIVYAVHTTGYNTFSLENLDAPMLIVAGNTAQFGWKQLVANGSGLGIAAVGPNSTDDGLHDISLYDIHDPTRTNEFLATFETPGLTRAVSIYNGLAYVADGDSGLQVINYLPSDILGLSPTITLSTNSPSGVAEEGILLSVTANVTDDVQVRNVEFYVDGVKVATDGNFPFEHSLITPVLRQQPSVTLRAKASDTGGNTAETDERVLELVPDGTPPRIIRVYPSDGAIVSRIGTLVAFFSELIDPATLSPPTFSLKEAGLDGAWDTEDDVAVPGGLIEFRREGLGGFMSFPNKLPEGAYRARITTEVVDLARNPLSSERTWGFQVFDVQNDRDQDLVPDLLEPVLNLDPDNPDTDNDLIADGDEDFDGDGLSNFSEIKQNLDPANPDIDSDGLLDGEEFDLGTDPRNPDTDGDGLLDANERLQMSNPLDPDTDDDGLLDGQELILETDPRNPDSDRDALLDGEEVVMGSDGFVTDPRRPDTDGDGLLDGEEVFSGADGFITDPLSRDTDQDGLEDSEEVTPGLDGFLTGPVQADSDTDGLGDGVELERHTHPLVPDTDGDALSDGQEIVLGTNPLTRDSDGDGLLDGIEVNFGLNPLQMDSDGNGVNDAQEDLDGDGLSNLEELNLATDPRNPDTDADLLLDSEELASQCNPLVPDTTRVIGRTITKEGVPIEGAQVQVLNRRGVSLSEGRFSFTGVAACQAVTIRAIAEFKVGDLTLQGASIPLAPVVRGTTDVGDVVLLPRVGGALYPGSEFPVGFIPSSVVTADLNADGFLDVVTANAQSRDISVLLGNGDGTFEMPRAFVGVNGQPVWIGVADLNGDGAFDLVSAASFTFDNGGGLSVLLGNGDGTFQPAQSFASGDAPNQVAIADFNGDLRLDMVSANTESFDLSLLLGNGDGTFQPQERLSLSGAPAGVVSDDLNRDGFIDLVTANQDTDKLSMLLGNGDGTFQEERQLSVSGGPTSLAVVDINADGSPDILAATTHTADVAVLLGNGDGIFEAERRFGVGLAPRLLTFADLNDDTFLDVITATSDDERGSGNPGRFSVLLGNGNGTFQPSLVFSVGLGLRAIAVADVDADQIPDLLTAHLGSIQLVAPVPFPGELAILLGKGDGTFEQRVDLGVEARSVTTADLNADRVLDVVASNVVLLGRGDGTFQDPQEIVADGVLPSAVGDLNADEFLDLVVVYATSNEVSVSLNDGDGTFQAEVRFPVGESPIAVAIAEINGDHVKDIVTANQLSGDLSILLGNGNGIFQLQQRVAVSFGDLRAVAIGDLNGDGQDDLVVANPFLLSVFLGNGDGTFQAEQQMLASGIPNAVTIVDLNRDGALDLVSANSSPFLLERGALSILLGNGNGTFQPEQRFDVGPNPLAVAVADLNGDDVPDVVTTSSGEPFSPATPLGDEVFILLGNGDGTFQPRQQFAVGQDPLAVVVGDLNGDGRPDIVIANFGNLSILLRR